MTDDVGSRVTSGEVRLKYSLTGKGWARADLVVGGVQSTITASYLSDALESLVLGVALIGEGLAESRFSWDEEPGEYRWLLSREPDEIVRLRILAFDQLWGNAPDDDGRIVVDAHVDRGDLMRVVLRAAKKVLDDLGEDEYQRRWIEYPFPSKALARLRGALDELGPRIVHWHELIRSRPQMWFAEQNRQPTDLLVHVLADAMYDLATAKDSVCLADIYDRSATVIDDGPGLPAKSIGLTDGLVARFGTLLTPSPDVRGCLAHVVALCSSFEVESVSDLQLQTWRLRSGVPVGVPQRTRAAPDISSFTRIVLKPDWTYFGAEPGWPRPLPDLVSVAADLCRTRAWWSESIIERVGITDRRDDR